MTDATLPVGRSGSAFAFSPWRAVCIVFAVVAIGLFLYFGYVYGKGTRSELRLLPYLRYDLRVDFAYFFAGADMAWHGDAKDLYPEPGEWTYYPDDLIFLEPHDEYTLARYLARGNYYNPPALAYMHSPLTTLSFKHAYWLFSTLAVTALCVFLYLSWRAGRSIPEMPFFIAGVLAFRPAHEALIMGHMTLFFVLVMGAGFLLLKAEKRLLAGLVFSLLALKPQWAILPGLFLLVRGEWKSLFTMGFCSAALFFIPFGIVGQDTFENYLQFLRRQSTLDLKDAPHMFSWNGFLFKEEGGWLYGHPAPSEKLIYALIAVTTLPLLIVWWSRDYLLGVAATVLAMLLISTHSVWYDWALLVVAGLFLVLRARDSGRGYRVEMWLVMLALFLATGHSIGVLLAPDRHFIDWHRPGLFVTTPIAFAALVWMASVAVRERLPHLPFRRRDEVAATA